MKTYAQLEADQTREDAAPASPVAPAPAAAKPPPAPQLPYDGVPAPPVTRRGFRLLLGLTLLNTTMMATFLLGPHLSPFIHAQWEKWQASREARRERAYAVAVHAQCLTHVSPPDKVLYEEHPARAIELLASGAAYEPAVLLRQNYTGERPPPGWQPPVRAKPPDYFTRLWRTMGGRGDVFANAAAPTTLLFLHERVTPRGEKWMVIVELETATRFNTLPDPAGAGETWIQDKRRRLNVTVYDLAGVYNHGRPAIMQEQTLTLLAPDRRNHVVARGVPSADELSGDASPAAPARAALQPLDYGNILRFFPGQPDPADRSHFTIAYQLDGTDGVIDGWVKDEGVILRPRSGRPAYEGTEDAWDLAAPDAPAAATQPSPR